jgi:hypothetical protein
MTELLTLKTLGKKLDQNDLDTYFEGVGEIYKTFDSYPQEDKLDELKKQHKQIKQSKAVLGENLYQQKISEVVQELKSVHAKLYVRAKDIQKLINDGYHSRDGQSLKLGVALFAEAIQQNKPGFVQSNNKAVLSSLVKALPYMKYEKHGFGGSGSNEWVYKNNYQDPDGKTAQAHVDALKTVVNEAEKAGVFASPPDDDPFAGFSFFTGAGDLTSDPKPEPQSGGASDYDSLFGFTEGNGDASTDTPINEPLDLNLAISAAPDIQEDFQTVALSALVNVREYFKASTAEEWTTNVKKLETWIKRFSEEVVPAWKTPDPVSENSHECSFVQVKNDLTQFNAIAGPGLEAGYPPVDDVKKILENAAIKANAITKAYVRD